MTDAMLKAIGEKYPLTEKDAGDFAKIKVRGMTFDVNAYDAAGLGHVSVMRASGMLGLMKMDTLIIDPLELDLPLYSYDRILAMGSDTLIIELYDTLISDFTVAPMQALCDKYASLPDRDPGTHWYDGIRLGANVSKKGKKLGEQFDAFAKEYLETFLSCPAVPVTDKDAKRAAAARYVNGLLEHGGPSTDVFMEKIGRERCTDLFGNVLFGTE